MQIKTIKDGVASLRKVTIGHAVRILVCEVLQAEGYVDWMQAGNGPQLHSMFDCHLAGAKPDRFHFMVEDEKSLEFTGNSYEVERFLKIVDLALKAGRMRREKFDSFSQKVWMASVLHGYENIACDRIAYDRSISLYALAEEIDRIINRRNIETVAA